MSPLDVVYVVIVVVNSKFVVVKRSPKDEKNLCNQCYLCDKEYLDLGIAEGLRKVGVSLLESPGL